MVRKSNFPENREGKSSKLPSAKESVRVNEETTSPLVIKTNNAF